MKDNLFILIKSLSKSEKGYFKKHSSFYGRSQEKNNYIKIFDAMNVQKEYNEQKLLRKFKTEGFINQFSVAKNYLYNTILDSLEAYNKTVNIGLRSAMNGADILVDKGLLTQAQKLLKKAKRIAVQYNKFTYVTEINLMEQRIYYLQSDIQGLKASSKVLAAEHKKALKQIESSVLTQKEKQSKNKLDVCLN